MLWLDQMQVNVPDGRAELTPDDAGAEEVADETRLPEALETGAN